jgi:glycosyltransferase involved in cell wall biosynthesis
MKITIATGPIYPVPAVIGGSVQILWHGLAKEFVKRGHEVTILAKAFPGQPETENRDGIRIVRWGGYGLTTSLAADLVKCFFYALGAVRRMPAGDVVVTNDFWTPALLPRLRPDAGRVFLNANRYPKHQYWLYGKVAGISAASGEVASEIERQAPKLARRVKVVPNAIDSCFLENEGDRLRLRLRLRNEEEKRSPLTVLYAGRIHPEKGIEILIEAWRILTKDMEYRKSDIESRQSPISNIRNPISGSGANWKGAKLRIVGPYRKEQGGGGAEYLESLKKKAEGVEWGEPVYGVEELAAVYDQGDILVYPSVAETGEAMPLAPLEGMARGLPVVVSNLEVFREYLVQGQNGVSFEHRGGRAAENLADALAKLIEDPSLRQAMSKEARATAEKYAPGNVAELYVQAFENLLKN